MSNQTSERPITVHAYQQYLAEEKIMASHCLACSKLYLPTRAICPVCKVGDMAWRALSGEGKLAAFTAVYIVNSQMAAEGYGRDKPNLSGVVELAEGVKVTAQILGMDASHPEQIEIGISLQAEFISRQQGEKEQIFLAFRAV